MSLPPETSGPPLAAAQAVLTIDLGALAANWRTLRDHAAPAECGAVVKADAYGIGIEPAVRTLAGAGCCTFFVAHASEGARVRAELGEKDGYRIYCLNGMAPVQKVFDVFIESGLRPVIGSRAELDAWIKQGVMQLPQMPIALQFNTGMNRLGIDADEAGEVLDLLRSAGLESKIDFVMSHFVSSEDERDPLNEAQIRAFEHVRNVFAGFRFSMANSSGILLPQKPHYDLVRPGYALYGGNPSPGQSNPMKPVVKLQAPILQLRTIEAGQSTGYNAQWIAMRRSRLATIGIGYADGLPRSAMNTSEKPGAQAIVAGRLCPLVGRVSMDLVVIDVTDVPEPAIAPGAMVELLGESITIDDLGERAGTIGYEILTSLGRRYHRIYLNS